MCMGADPDYVADFFLEEFAYDEYFKNEKLIEEAEKRYLDFQEDWYVGEPMSHIPWQSYEFLYEARMTHSFAFFRSSIFCCAAAIDWELKRCLIDALPSMANTIESQTLGQSIHLLQEKGVRRHLLALVDDLNWLNRLRNEVSVHSHSQKSLKSMIETMRDDDNARITNRFELKSDPRSYFTSQELSRIDQTETMADVEWLRLLSLKAIMTARRILISSSGEGPRGSRVKELRARVRDSKGE